LRWRKERGAIVYTGNPQVTSDVTGVGAIIRRRSGRDRSRNRAGIVRLGSRCD
jgi:hypothetical protein